MGNRKALVVGIDDYLTCPLSGCCNDAEAIKDLLANHEDGNPNFAVWKKDNVQTMGELKGLIEQCFEGDSDVALFYYSGHGHIDEVGGYLVTPDYSSHNYGVSLSEILSIANQSKCKERVIILDSCFSGFMGSINTASQDTATIKEGVTILTASRNNETSVEVGGHGVFTNLLIEALNGGASDITGHVTIGGIYAFIDKALGPWEQRPVFKTNVTRFTSIRSVRPQVNIEVIRNICKYFNTPDEQMALDPSFEPTNSTEDKHHLIEPYATETNMAKFAELQKLESIGLVAPVGEDHMYFAAMNSKKCKLTAIGKQYWKLVNEHKI